MKFKHNSYKNVMKPWAIDPQDCGCTECCVGEYLPLGRAGWVEYIRVILGDIDNHTDLSDDELDCLARTQVSKYHWDLFERINSKLNDITKSLILAQAFIHRDEYRVPSWVNYIDEDPVKCVAARSLYEAGYLMVWWWDISLGGKEFCKGVC